MMRLQYLFRLSAGVAVALSQKVSQASIVGQSLARRALPRRQASRSAPCGNHPRRRVIDRWGVAARCVPPRARLSCLGLIASGGAAADPQPTGGDAKPSCSTCYTWKPLRIGAGGWLTGMDISADGSTRVVRTDTYGAYVWESTRWKH